MAKLNTPANSSASRRKTAKRARRRPLATLGLIAIGLGLTGGVYAAANAVPSAANADSTTTSAQAVSQGEKLFQANCASCHGMQAQGTTLAPSLAGVGAAAVDFQVGTGRMPLQNEGPQAEQKPVQFTQSQIDELAAYVATLGPGPAIPSSEYTNGDVSNDQLAQGAELFRVNCAMCHNVAGAGGALTEGKYAPALTSVSPTHIYEAMVTGPQNMPVFNDLNITPQQKNEIISYLLYLRSHPSPGGLELGSLGPSAEGLFLWIFGLGAVVGFAVWITAKSN